MSVAGRSQTRYGVFERGFLRDDYPSMDTVILCGGQGMRAWPLTEDCPKPLLKVGGVELVLHIMRLYRRYDRRRFVLCVGYAAKKFKHAFPKSRCEHEDIEVEFSDSGPDAGTALRIADAAHLCDGNIIHVTYGDGLADVDITKLEATATKHMRPLTMTVVRPRSQFGEVRLDGGRVTSFVEKPVVNSWINGGYMVLAPRAVAMARAVATTLPETMFVHHPLPQLVRGDLAAAHKHKGHWACIDTSKDLQALQAAYERGELAWLG